MRDVLGCVFIASLAVTTDQCLYLRGIDLRPQNDDRCNNLAHKRMRSATDGG